MFGKLLRSKLVEKAALWSRQRRTLSLHEYQCKEILAENALAVQRFGVARDVETAIQVAKNLGTLFDYRR